MTWEVDGRPGLRVKLNSEFVSLTGERIVQPRSSSKYRIYALLGGDQSILGSVDLDVNLSECNTFELTDPQGRIEGAISNSIDNMDDVYKKREPIVEFSRNRISFDLKLGADIDWLPDPTIRIEGSFGLGVDDGSLISWGEEVSANVTVPWWAWSIPGALPGLAIALSQAESQALAEGRNVIAGLVALIQFIWTTADGFRRHSVRVGTYDDGSGLIEVTECPYEPILEFVRFEARRMDAEAER